MGVDRRLFTGLKIGGGGVGYRSKSVRTMSTMGGVGVGGNGSRKGRLWKFLVRIQMGRFQGLWVLLAVLAGSLMAVMKFTMLPGREYALTLSDGGGWVGGESGGMDRESEVRSNRTGVVLGSTEGVGNMAGKTEGNKEELSSGIVDLREDWNGPAKTEVEDLPSEGGTVEDGYSTDDKIEGILYRDVEGKSMPKHLLLEYTDVEVEPVIKADMSGSNTGLKEQKISRDTSLDASRLVLFEESNLKATNYAKPTQVDRSQLPAIKVGVMDIDPRLTPCLESAKCKRTLGAWDYTLHLFFRVYETPIEEADFVFVPFYQFCYLEKKKCAGRSTKELLTWELQRAKAQIKSMGRSNVTLVVPMSHDFGACARFAFNGYALNFTYEDILQDVIVIQPNGDFDQNCYQSQKDIVVPAFTGIPFFKKPYNLADFFGDSSQVIKSSQRKHLFFSGFSRDFSQRREGVRAWLIDPANWHSTSMKRASKISQYIESIGDSVFCLVPPGKRAMNSF